MTSWAVVCDVYFLEPQTKWPDENAQQFAERVQKMIAERAKLQIAPWDGYLKYYTLGVKVGPLPKLLTRLQLWVHTLTRLCICAGSTLRSGMILTECSQGPLMSSCEGVHLSKALQIAKKDNLNPAKRASESVWLFQTSR